MRRRRRGSFSKCPRSLNSNEVEATVIGIIPARYGSKRLPGKPLLDLGGKPIIQHVYERAKQARLLKDVLVATDDERIADAVNKFGGKAVMTPITLQSGSDRVAYAAKAAEAEVIVNVQGDEPLIEPEMIDETVQALLDNEGVEVSTPVKKIVSSDELSDPNIVKVVLDENDFAMYFSRSAIPFLRSEPNQLVWSKRHQYYKHVGLYVYRKKFLLTFTQWDVSPLEEAEQLEQLRILEHGHSIKCVVTEHDSFSVDTVEALEHLRTLMSTT
jgi:3-deoxy-manno-octulosonate cytidylyltransferase (CMP-KDO synthetase)